MWFLLSVVACIGQSGGRSTKFKNKFDLVTQAIALSPYRDGLCVRYVSPEQDALTQLYFVILDLGVA